LAVSALPAGRTYPVYFAIDLAPGNNKLDLDKLFLGTVNVVR
jgi:hypothetical protein